MQTAQHVDPSQHDPRQQPTPDLIAALRQRYPTEAEIDRVLTRKMQSRAASAYISLNRCKKLRLTGNLSVRPLSSMSAVSFSPRVTRRIGGWVSCLRARIRRSRRTCARR